MTVRIVHTADVPPQAWKNGGGHTRELLATPSPDDWQLRISIADIDADGPFSPYPGVERWFAVIDGAGVELRFADGARRVTPHGPPLHFAGAAAPACRLIDGPTRDLNLMLRQGRGGMDAVEPDTDWGSPAAQCGLFAAEAGTWCCHDGRRITLPARTLLWLEQAPRLAQRFSATGWWLRFSPEPVA